MMQTVIVLLVVAAAAAYLGVRVWRSMRSARAATTGAGCGSACGCGTGDAHPAVPRQTARR